MNYEIVRTALDSGHQMILLAFEVAAEFQDHPSVLWIRIPCSRTFTNLVGTRIFARRSANWLKSHRHEIDVIHANGFVTWEASDLNSVHFVHSSWLKSPIRALDQSIGPHQIYQWLYTAVNAASEKNAFHKAKIVVAVSELIRQQLIEIGVPDNRIRVILNGVDLEEFFPGCVNRHLLGLPEHVPLAIFIGDIRTNRKNLDTVLKSFAKVPAECHLAVVGDKTNSPYPQMADKLGIASRVHFLGFRHDIAQLLRAADLLVFPSRYEPYGLVILEALASGVPVITASTCGGATVVNSDCGVVLSDPNDVEGLTQAWLHIINDSATRITRQKAARATAELYSWQRMANEYLQLYKDLVKHADQR